MSLLHRPFLRTRSTVHVSLLLSSLIAITIHHATTALLSSHFAKHTTRIRDISSFPLRVWNDNDINGSNNNNNNPSDNPFFNQNPQQPYFQAPAAAASLTPLKVMIFIDGTWLYYQIFERNTHRDVIAQKLGMKDWRVWHEIDWARLPMVACQALLQDKKSSWSAIMAPTTSGGVVQPTPQRPIEVMRVSVYSSMHRETPEDSYRFQMFQNMRKAGFDVNMIETLGPWGAGEKCVDIQLAVDMLYYATVPDAYDVALLLTGDRDFLPAVIRCRQKGRRIGIVSMKSAASIAFEETPNLKDYDTIWLEDYVEQWTRKVDKPLPVPTNKPPKKPILAPATKSSSFSSASAPTHEPSTKISEYILNKVLMDFISGSESKVVSSRDVGRFLKSLKVGDRTVLEEVKDVYGGLYQFVTLSKLFFVQGDSRVFVRNFWVGLVPEDEREDVLDDEEEARANLSDEELTFLDEYAYLPKLNETSYEFTLNDRDPNQDPENTDISIIMPTNIVGKQKAHELNECTVVQLKDICRENNLPVSGKKIDLLERIQNHFALKIRNDIAAMDKVDPSTRLEMLVLEYVKAAGGEASSRDVGRYLTVNQASNNRLALSNGGRRVSALQEMKELHGALLKFVEWSSLLNYGRELSVGSFSIIPAPNAEKRLEEKIGSSIMD
jgi:NYN domain/SAP domain